MALQLYGGDFKNQATLMLRGCAHILCLGDSQSYIGRAHTLFNRYLPASLKVRWNYVIWGVAGGQSTNYGFSSAPSTPITSCTTTLYGGNATDYTSGAGTAALGAPTWRHAFSGDSTDTDWDGGGGAWQLMRLASNTTTGKQMPWPLDCGNGNAPWYHGEYVKSLHVVQGMAAGTGVLSFDMGIARRGVSAPSNAETWKTITVADTATIQALAFSDPLADAGNYATGTSAGNVNDHLIYVNQRCTTAYNENGLSLVIMKTMVARCDSGGTITWNNTDGLNSGAGFDTIGRSGSAITDWETNYWTQTQWQEYFAATVFVPNLVTVMPIMLGHNGTQYSGSAVTAAFTASWLAFISKIRAAYEAAFPIAIYPTRKLHIMIVQPWYSTRDNNFFQATGVAGGRSMLAAYQAIAAQTADCSWCSLFNYFGEAAPFDSLHPDDETSGWMLSNAFMDMLHRSTNFRYTTQGAVASTTRRRAGVR